ncbi:unnamed protein product [Rotaria socialis]|uniref:ABC transporter domain-containing protein n=1 Tax=Rotaria socialis TaxID=392032 RepID=A0A818NVN0_9BILA|nr:unnamed protein product [Rotaria socialis]CAF3611082.1 unnamed protein product [Rotaria socialis]
MAAVNQVSTTVSSTGTISFHNINYTVGTKARSHKRRSKCLTLPFFKVTEQKQILFDVSGRFMNGMNAILGPSGSGKSSLLDILADRKDPRGTSGIVLVDNFPRHPSFRYTVGYVVQEDICSGTLTVRENLYFSVSLRLSEALSASDKRVRVSTVITELSLEACADTRVGTEFLRGISGGEKKRTCIGMELVLSPNILFLDEPTTGLDASTAISIMNCLKDLSRRGRTIIFSIHQPRYSIFKLFDTVMLMCNGQCVYHGSAKGVVPYFSTHDYQCEPYDNPADFALDVLIDIGRKPDIIAKLNDLYNKTDADTSAAFPRPGNMIDLESLDHKRRKYKVQAARSLGAEIFYLSQRTLRNSFRNPALALSQISVSIILGAMVGLLFYDLKKTTDSGVQNRLGAIFFISLNQIFINVTAIDALLKERALFIHEYASGYYRIFTYFIAKLLCDLLPMRVIPTILFSIISYFMMGLSRTISQFFIFLLTIFIASLFGSAMCFFISAITSIFPVALIIAILICVMMTMFSGFVLDLDSVFKWLSWIQWTSASRYVSNLLIINEFQGLTFCLSNQTNVCPMTGEQILDNLDIPHANSWDLWKNFLALTIMTVLFLISSYIQLIRIKKTK